jgi:hypothetical protein|tara:strand:+ start:1050 stop:1361 length:312 start_codon:yes stop_codon:yes gene_type:complete
MWEKILKSELIKVGTNMQDADFWLIRVHDANTVGKPVKEFKPQYIGIKIIATDKLDPQFMYYWFMNLQQNQKYWYQMAIPDSRGTYHIRISDLKDLIKRIVVQ